MTTPRTLQEAIAYFADPKRAFDYAVKLRFPDGRIYCPRCGAEKFSFIKTRRIWFCYACKKQFTVKVKTIMEDSALGLDKWMVAIWMISNARNGISSHELARSLGITQKSAWFMLHRIRKALKESFLWRWQETWRRRERESRRTKRSSAVASQNMHKGRKHALQPTWRRLWQNKTIVHGMLWIAQSVKVRATVVPERKARDFASGDSQEREAWQLRCTPMTRSPTSDGLQKSYRA
jgi:transposase-like protein